MQHKNYKKRKRLLIFIKNRLSKIKMIKTRPEHVFGCSKINNTRGK